VYADISNLVFLFLELEGQIINPFSQHLPPYPVAFRSSCSLIFQSSSPPAHPAFLFSRQRVTAHKEPTSMQYYRSRICFVFSPSTDFPSFLSRAFFTTQWGHFTRHSLLFLPPENACAPQPAAFLYPCCAWRIQGLSDEGTLQQDIHWQDVLKIMR